MIEVGKLWRCLDLLEVISMSFVLLSLSFLDIFNERAMSSKEK